MKNQYLERSYVTKPCISPALLNCVIALLALSQPSCADPRPAIRALLGWNTVRGLGPDRGRSKCTKAAAMATSLHPISDAAAHACRNAVARSRLH